MAYNFDKKIQTANFEIQVDTVAHYGYFEHNELGDECGGGLWFEVMPKSESGLDTKLELIDADGTYSVPKEVCKALRDAGFIVSEDFE